MAKKKRQTTTRFSIQGFDLNHYRATEQYAAAVQALFDRATLAIARSAASRNIDPDKPFSFDDYPEVKAELQKVVGQLASQLQTTIETGSKKQWLFACDKNDGFIDSIMDTSKLSKARLKKMQDRNLDALSTFQGRKVSGMDLSQRVWRYVGQFKEQLESALDVGLGEGRSAQELARDVKKNLREPDRLFRRVRDKRGNLVLSKAARAYHPGQGVYRSSVKNAQRLTRSEINMAYRESDFLRWQQLDFVVGFEIHRSNHEPLCKCKMCDRLQGRYPKTFKFKGWHPQCMCYAVPILMDEETFDENELGDLKAALRGTEYKKKQSRNLVTDVPDGFKEWVEENKEASAGWSSTPYFIQDNFVDGDLLKGLKIELPTLEPDVPGLSFMPIKTVKEATALATTLGIKRVDFGDATIDEINIALEVLHEASQQMDFELDYFFLAKDLHKLPGHRASKPMGGFFNADKGTMAIDLTTFRESQFKPVVGYQDKIVSLRNNIANLERQIADSEARLGRSKSMDKMLKADIKMFRSRISDIEIKIKSFEKLIASGHDALPLTVAATFKDIKQQIQAEIWHEIGHYVDNKTGRLRFKEGNFISEYSKDMRGEEFAEWFSYYKMHGEKGVPADLLKIFKSVERNTPAKPKPKIDPVQVKLDALMPSIEAARKICQEWGIVKQEKRLNEAIAEKDIKTINGCIAAITSLGTKYTTEMSTFFGDTTKVIKEMNEAGGDFATTIAELMQYMTNLSKDKKMWPDSATFYQSELAKTKDKLKQYKASPEASMTASQKSLLADVRQIIRVAEEWGIKTTKAKDLLQKFLDHPNFDWRTQPDSENYARLLELEFFALSDKVDAIEKKCDKFIIDAQALLKEADKVGLDVMDESRNELSKWVFSLKSSGKAYTWAQFKSEINTTFNTLKTKVDEATKKKAEEEAAKADAERLKAFDDVNERLGKTTIIYNEVKKHEKEVSEADIIERVGGGDMTTGSCASLAFVYAANKAGLDVLDFRDGESRSFFANYTTIGGIAGKVGGIRDFHVSGIDLMKKTEIGKEYYLASGGHAAIVRQVSKGKYEYLELQSRYSNGWKPLNSSVFASRFSSRGRGIGVLMEIGAFMKIPGFQKMMGYINTKESEQKKGTKGSIK